MYFPSKFYIILVTVLVSICETFLKEAVMAGIQFGHASRLMALDEIEQLGGAVTVDELRRGMQARMDVPESLGQYMLGAQGLTTLGFLHDRIECGIVTVDKTTWRYSLTDKGRQLLAARLEDMLEVFPRRTEPLAA